MKKKVCHCGVVAASRGLCTLHYQRYRKSPDFVITGRIPIPIEDRFWEKVEKIPGWCWLWTAGANDNGYGTFWDGTYTRPGRSRMVGAHIWVYERYVGPRNGLDVMHRCDTPLCVNYERCLMLGTRGDNNRDRAAKGRSARGESHPQVKLTEIQARTILARYRAGGIFMRELAEEYSVSRGAIDGLVSGRNWKHLH